MAAADTLVRPGLILVRFLQWSSAVIVMGITSHFIRKFPTGQHVIYEEVIAVLSVAFFLPGLLSAFVKKLGQFALFVDVVFSYLWLTAFIFTAQDYNSGNCALIAPPGGGCDLKKTSESFAFLAFFFTLCAALLEIFRLWTGDRCTSNQEVHKEHA